MISFIKKLVRVIIDLPYIIFFNFYYLPFNQAIHLPIWLNKPKFIKLKGKIHVNFEASRGSIRLGEYIVSTIPNNGIILDIAGDLTFNGPIIIGSSSAICIGRTGHLVFGSDITVTASCIFSCFYRITIDSNTTVSWNCEFYDTDFHLLTNATTRLKESGGYAPIYIGKNSWICQGCKIMKGVSLANFTTVGSYTKLFGKKINNEYCIIVNRTEISILKQGLYFNVNDCNIQYDDITTN